MRPAASRAAIALSLAVAVGALDGCIALPFGVPPSKIDLGTGVRAVTGGPPDVPVSLRAGLAPLQLDRALLARRVDFGVGYALDTGARRTVHGAYAEIGGVVVSWRGASSVLRVVTTAQARLLVDRESARIGRGGALQVSIENVSFEDGAFESWNVDGGAVGVAYGESGVGAYVEASTGDTSVTTAAITAGLVVRLPAAGGLFAASLLSRRHSR